jgi:hypothetical protein
MPAPAYYRGRPARFWIAIMSGPGRAAEANQDAAASPASQRPAAAAGTHLDGGEDAGRRLGAPFRFARRGWDSRVASPGAKHVRDVRA